ncbi:unnamed protein product [Somion occarium]|uniref:Uncharacterized protein n=1 Tax=Somion occarium TaxID=3059160 RepID=A0ABP1CJY0_9APHY
MEEPLTPNYPRTGYSALSTQLPHFPPFLASCFIKGKIWSTFYRSAELLTTSYTGSMPSFLARLLGSDPKTAKKGWRWMSVSQYPTRDPSRRPLFPWGFDPHWLSRHPGPILLLRCN